MRNSSIKLIKIASVLLICSIFSAVVSSATNKAEQNIVSSGAEYAAMPLINSESEVFDEAACNSKGYCTTLRKGFKQVSENNNYILYFNGENAETALYCRETGNYFYSNPSDEELEKENMLAGTEKDRLRSQIVVIGYSSKGVKYVKDTYNDCILYGGMTYSVTDKGVEVSYSIGKKEITVSDLPQQISDKRFEHFLSALSEEDAAKLKKAYQKASVKGKTDKDIIKAFKEKYPNIENNDIYYLRYTSSRMLEGALKLWEEAGYTGEDLIKDNEENGIEVEANENIGISLILNYTLDNDGLSASVNASQIKTSGDIVVSEIKLLPQFGCGGNNESGYILVPDGSGALMHFNNGKNTSVFSMKVYGDDTAMAGQSDYQTDKKLSLPVFGIKRNKAAFIAIISDGDAMAAVNAGTSGSESSFNGAYASFTVYATQTVELAKGSEALSAEKQPYSGNFTVSYKELTEERNNYIGMANTYREMLLKKGKLKKSEDECVVLADVLGGITSEKSFLGLKIDTFETLSDFGQTEQMLKELREAGVEKVTVLLDGAFNKGLNNEYSADIIIPSEMGGKSGLNKLLDVCQKGGNPIYAKINISNIGVAGNGYNKSKMNIRGISGDISVKYEYDYVNRYRKFNNRSTMLITPNLFAETADGMLKDLKAFNTLGIAIYDISSELYSDFSLKHYSTRQNTVNFITDVLQNIANQKKVAVSSPNAYALGYGNLVYDLPLTSSLFNCCDDSVPFYQTVLRGCGTYSSQPVNYAADYKHELLKAAEYGSAVQYTVSANSTASLKESDFSYINSGLFTDWKNEIVRAYKWLSPIIEQSRGSTISAHGRLSKELSYTEYSNGLCVYVNYGDTAVTVDGIEIAAQNYGTLVRNDEKE